MALTPYTRAYGNLPLTQITPFTYRDGLTFLQILNEFEKWLREVSPEIDGILKTYFDQYKADHQAILDGIIETKDQWDALFEAFMADITNQLAILNDNAVSQLVGDDGSATNNALELFTFNQVLSSSKLNTRLQPKALSKVKAILSGAVEEPVYTIFLGSSTTNGAFSSPGMHYPAQLTRKIGASLPLRSDPVMFLLSESAAFMEWSKPGLYMANGGVGGYTARNFYGDNEASRINTIVSDHRAVVFMMIGSNDQYYGYTPANFQANVQAAINDIKFKSRHGVAFVLIHSFGRADKATFDYPWSEYLESLYKISDADPVNVMTIDLEQHYRDLDVMGVDLYGFGSGDLVHNNEKSHTFTADWLGKYLELSPGPHYSTQGVTMVDSFTDSDGKSATLHLPESYQAETTTEKENLSRWELGSGSSGFEIQSGGLASTGSSGFLYTDSNDPDHTVSAKVAYGSPGTRGVFVRYNPDDNSRLSFYMAGASVILSRSSSVGTTTVLMEVPVTFEADRDNVLTQTVNKRQILCYFNGELKIAYTMPENVYALHMGQSAAGLRATAPGRLYEEASVFPIGG